MSQVLSTIVPKRLKVGDEVRIIAPSCSLSLISELNIRLAVDKLESLGLVVTFGKNVRNSDEFYSSSIKDRVDDLHEAFTDKNVKLILPVIGGHNCNQILNHLDYELIKSHPKILGGFSDTTALHNAIFAKTGLITFQTPSFSTFAKQKNSEYTINYFVKAVMQDGEYKIENSLNWDDSPWYDDQNNYELYSNPGSINVNNINTSGTIIGGNLCTLNLLQGTAFMPKFDTPIILFLEDDNESSVATFDRDLVSLIQQDLFKNVTGIVIGRFQSEFNIKNQTLLQILKSKDGLEKISIIANVDFGHTSPLASFPVGGKCRIENGEIFINW